MKTLKLLNSCLLGLAATLLVTAVFAFINGNVMYGICNILWMGTEIIYFSINEKSIEIKQREESVYAFLSDINDIIAKHGAAIITEDKDGYWQTTGGICVEHGNTSCTNETNEQHRICTQEK